MGDRRVYTRRWPPAPEEELMAKTIIFALDALAVACSVDHLDAREEIKGLRLRRLLASDDPGGCPGLHR